MKSISALVPLLVAVVGLSSVKSGSAEPAAVAPHPLVWDTVEKTLTAKLDESAADFVFTVTNTSEHAVTITEVKPSCTCTSLEHPLLPWTLAPGESGKVAATVDFSGKDGFITKSLAVTSSAGLQSLLMRVATAARDEAGRLRNQQIAQKDRQAVFQGTCASCHAAPAGNRQSQALFLAVCAVCHVTPHRASIVPDLLVARGHRDAAWWRQWIRDGKAGTLMPAFARANGGPLTDSQIESLVSFALDSFPTEARKND